MSRFFHRHQKAIIWIVVLSFFIGSVVLVGLNQAGVFRSAPTQDSDLPDFVARVNGEEIAVSAMYAVANQIFGRYQSFYQQLGQDASVLLEGANGARFVLDLQADATEEVIRRALYEQEAQSRGIRVGSSQIEAAFTEAYGVFLQQNSITEAQLIAYLEQQGTTLETYQDSLRVDAERQLREAAVGEAVAGLIAPTEDELLAFYEANIADYDRVERIRASHVLVEDLETAREVRALVDEGADFAELASIYSIDTGSRENGGDLDFFERGVMVSEFEEAAFALRVGEVSDPVQSEFGYHIILLTDREEARTPSLDEVRGEVTSDYTAEEADQRVSEWYEARLAASQVEIAFPKIDAVLQQRIDVDLGLAAFLQILDEGTVSDAYLPYYIGRIYESKAQEAAADRAEFEAIEEPTEADLARIEALQAEEEANEALALENYLMALEDVDADEAFLNRVLNLNPDSTDATYLLGKLFLDRGDYTQAEERFAAVIARDDTYVSAYIASGDLATRQGSYALARARYETALELRGNDTSVMLKLVTTHLELGALADAMELIDDLKAIDPGNVKVTIAEGDIASALLEEAVAEQEALEAKAGLTEAETARLEGLAGEIQTHYETAAAKYESGIQISGSLDLRTRLGQAHLLAGALDEAEDEFEAVIAMSPYTSAAFEGLGRVLIARGEIEEGLDNLQTALARSFETVQRERVAELIVQITPDDLDMRMELATIYAEQYKWSAAIGEYAEILAVDPADLEAALGIAEAYRWRGEHSTGIDYLERAKAATDLTTAKIRLNEAIVEVVENQVGEDEPLGPVGWDALIELAELRAELGDRQDASLDLDRVRTEAEDYRSADIEAILESITQTTSETIPSSVFDFPEIEETPESETPSDAGE